MNKSELIEKYNEKIETFDGWLKDGSKKDDSIVKLYASCNAIFQEIVADLVNMKE
jgi:hypothetical protein